VAREHAAHVVPDPGTALGRPHGGLRHSRLLTETARAALLGHLPALVVPGELRAALAEAEEHKRIG